MDIDSDYDDKIAAFQRRHDWEGLLTYCLALEKQISRSAKTEPPSEVEARSHLQILLDLEIAYTMLKMPKKQVQVAQKSLRMAKQVLNDPRDLFFCYRAVAWALDSAEQPEQARSMLVRAMTCLLAKWETEFLAWGLNELAAFDRTDRPEMAEALDELAADLRWERRWAHRASDRKQDQEILAGE